MLEMSTVSFIVKKCHFTPPFCIFLLTKTLRNGSSFLVPQYKYIILVIKMTLFLRGSLCKQIRKSVVEYVKNARFVYGWKTVSASKKWNEQLWFQLSACYVKPNMKQDWNKDHLHSNLVRCWFLLSK